MIGLNRSREGFLGNALRLACLQFVERIISFANALE